MGGPVLGAARPMIVSAYVAFAAFGAFWGLWGAAVPSVRDQAGISAGQLGFALLFIGAGALPAMVVMGKALDRWGLRLTAVTTGALGLVGIGLALTAVDLVSLCVGLAVVGATSGAGDVAINALAGRAERIAGRPVIIRAHGVFSSFVVIGSLATGVAAELPLVVSFVAVAVIALAAGAVLLRLVPAHATAYGHTTTTPVPTALWRITPLMIIGVLGALAFAAENAHQSWSAVFARDELQSSAGLSAVAPAVFAATVAITRFITGGLKSVNARTVLLVGASAAATGTVVIAAASTLFVAALGLAAAAAGTAVLFPTIVSVVSRNVDESHRGRATSVVTTVAYLGFLLGPVYVGLWAEAVGMRGAMLSVAALSVALFALTPILLRLSGFERRRRAHHAAPTLR
ncbi:hypothetical protein ALI144C_20270 [Actinosynnema sp. ALI-1.44]|uniref:MFS transporter n=1 Tax=Actinosynnema sp. ALI-1.44 TaxID=1933779 RepID=UPI00097BAB8D|nr:MFS transporter [Actinosynnema sp. ALI-1.44]ONI81634.1 hypothetical protein ALI144C_20270 [Actinosynnema sp. ALI-1.44]